MVSSSTAGAVPDLNQTWFHPLLGLYQTWISHGFFTHCCSCSRREPAMVPSSTAVAVPDLNQPWFHPLLGLFQTWTSHGFFIHWCGCSRPEPAMGFIHCWGCSRPEPAIGFIHCWDCSRREPAMVSSSTAGAVPDLNQPWFLHPLLGLFQTWTSHGFIHCWGCTRREPAMVSSTAVAVPDVNQPWFLHPLLWLFQTWTSRGFIHYWGCTRRELHTPSIAFWHLPPRKEGCRKPVLGVCVNLPRVLSAVVAGVFQMLTCQGYHLLTAGVFQPEPREGYLPQLGQNCSRSGLAKGTMHYWGKVCSKYD